MTEISIANYLTVLSQGLYVGFFICFVTKMIGYLVDKIVSLFKRV